MAAFGDSTLLIVEENASLSALWARHLERLGATVVQASGFRDAVSLLNDRTIALVVLDIDLAEDTAFAIAEYARCVQPKARIVCVTSSGFFSNGAIFRCCENACAFLPIDTKPDDLAAVVEHFGQPD